MLSVASLSPASSPSLPAKLCFFPPTFGIFQQRAFSSAFCLLPLSLVYSSRLSTQLHSCRSDHSSFVRLPVWRRARSARFAPSQHLLRVLHCTAWHYFMCWLTCFLLGPLLQPVLSVSHRRAGALPNPLFAVTSSLDTWFSAATNLLVPFQSQQLVFSTFPTAISTPTYLPRLPSLVWAILRMEMKSQFA